MPQYCAFRMCAFAPLALLTPVSPCFAHSRLAARGILLCRRGVDEVGAHLQPGRRWGRNRSKPTQHSQCQHFPARSRHVQCPSNTRPFPAPPHIARHRISSHHITPHRTQHLPTPAHFTQRTTPHHNTPHHTGPRYPPPPHPTTPLNPPQPNATPYHTTLLVTALKEDREKTAPTKKP